MSHNTASQNYNIKAANGSENMEKFIYLGTVLTDMHKIFKSMLNLGSTSNHLVQNFLPSFLHPRNIKTYKNIILPLVLYEYETGSLTLYI
jgi:hypothetical protein